MYYAVAMVILVVCVYFVWATFFNMAPTCFNNKQDGNELGIDCGGSCALVCSDIAHDPTVMWSRAFPSGNDVYTAAAYIRNNNVGSGAKRVGYAFYFFDENNSLVKEQDGVTDLPPVTVIPIIVPNVSVGNRTVASVKFAFSEKPIWYKVTISKLPSIFISQQHLAPDASRLSATLSNQTLLDAKNLTVEAVLFDEAGVARAASKSYVAAVSARSTQQVEFTWPAGVSNIVRVEITVLPSF
jgi:hypothetical protein